MEQRVLEALRDISPPFISCMRWVFKTGEHIYHVLDYHGGGTLSDLIDRYGPLPCHRVTFYAAELASGISSLHDAGIVHNALQPSNIAIETNGHIKITNFSQAFFLTGQRSKPTNTDPRRHPVMSQYRAPEVYLRWKIDSAVDCWSFGMIMYYLLFTSQPYGSRGKEWEDGWLADKIVNCAVEVEGIRLVHPMVRDIMAKCMERNPAVRWNIEQIKGHDYFAGMYVHVISILFSPSLTVDSATGNKWLRKV
ncbi:kinase-like protein [Agrocybe pediades]|nr:kinase-like protein [Agrocybe pediades]